MIRIFRFDIRGMVRFCERSIYWVLKYRNSPRKTMHKLYRYGFVDDHTPDTWKWTLSEAEKIENIGFENWLKTDGPKGYLYGKNK